LATHVHKEADVQMALSLTQLAYRRFPISQPVSASDHAGAQPSAQTPLRAVRRLLLLGLALLAAACGTVHPDRAEWTVNRAEQVIAGHQRAALAESRATGNIRPEDITCDEAGFFEFYVADSETTQLEGNKVHLQILYKLRRVQFDQIESVREVSIWWLPVLTAGFLGPSVGEAEITFKDGRVARTGLRPGPGEGLQWLIFPLWPFRGDAEHASALEFMRQLAAEKATRP
jgi:hypothetical protein